MHILFLNIHVFFPYFLVLGEYFLYQEPKGISREAFVIPVENLEKQFTITTNKEKQILKSLPLHQRILYSLVLVVLYKVALLIQHLCSQHSSVQCSFETFKLTLVNRFKPTLGLRC